jgi:hypothetical protein
MSRAATLHKKAYNRIFQAELRVRLKAEGLCQWCGTRPAKPSKRSPSGVGCRCEACSKKAARMSRSNLSRLRPAWAALGICTVCGCREAMPQQSRCGVCAEQQQESKQLRKEGKAAA